MWSAGRVAVILYRRRWQGSKGRQAVDAGAGRRCWSTRGSSIVLRLSQALGSRYPDLPY
jgi:hypothetical protein